MSHNTELRLKTPKERLQPPQSSYLQQRWHHFQTNVRRHHAVEDKALGFPDYLFRSRVHDQRGEGELDTAEHCLLTCSAFIDQRVAIRRRSGRRIEVRKIGGFLEEDRMRAVVY
ncbi:hypothetical protein BT69DRAFT_1275599 [Atractiella rhizophila]|nr:hypothetical protein BT69DRAFT_1275599 [Atractiella rhizophila]